MERDREWNRKGQERERVWKEGVSVTVLYANQSKQASPAKKAVRKVIKPRQKRQDFAAVGCQKQAVWAKNSIFLA